MIKIKVNLQRPYGAGFVDQIDFIYAFYIPSSIFEPFVKIAFVGSLTFYYQISTIVTTVSLYYPGSAVRTPLLYTIKFTPELFFSYSGIAANC